MKRRYFNVALLLILAIAFWFLAIDRSWFIERCPTCGYSRDVFQFRIFTVPVNERDREYKSLIQKVAFDLGVPCDHRNLVLYHKHRYWGLWICACPCINGVDRISTDLSWYDEKTSAAVKKLAENDPALPREFAERVLLNHDWPFWEALVQKIQTLDSQARHK
jgi:hypothetical protein